MDPSGEEAPDGHAAARGGVARKPTELDKDSWTSVLKRTVREFKEDHAVDWEAALTYYGVLAIFPTIVTLVSLLGLVVASRQSP